MGLTTYVPLAFNANPMNINLSGYPSGGLPSSATGANREQWHGYGPIKSIDSRNMKYEASSTGGASGSPVWIYYGSTGERYLVGLNRGHHNSDNDGTGVRFVTQNRNLIRSWMQLTDCCNETTQAEKLTFEQILENRVDLNGRPIDILSPKKLRLVSASLFHRKDAVPAQYVMQWIEGEFYEWEVFHVGGEVVEDTEATGDPESGVRPPLRYLRVLQPSKRFLSPHEASILLSASQLHQRATFPVAPEAYAELDDIDPVLPPQPRRRRSVFLSHPRWKSEAAGPTDGLMSAREPTVFSQ